MKNLQERPVNVNAMQSIGTHVQVNAAIRNDHGASGGGNQLQSEIQSDINYTGNNENVNEWNIHGNENICRLCGRVIRNNGAFVQHVRACKRKIVSKNNDEKPQLQVQQGNVNSLRSPRLAVKRNLIETTEMTPTNRNVNGNINGIGNSNGKGKGKSSSAIGRSRRRFRKTTARKSCHCLICGKSFDGFQALGGHMSAHRNDSDKDRNRNTMHKYNPIQFDNNI